MRTAGHGTVRRATLRAASVFPLVAALALVAGTAGLLPAGTGRVTMTTAAWVDREHVRGQVTAAASWCQAGLYSTEGRGQLLAGRLAGTDLATVAEVAPLHVRRDGDQTTVTPSTAVALGDDAYVNPLTVTAVQGLAVDLGSGLLSFPITAGQGAGALNQYARAGTGSSSAGASGTVSDSGAVDARTQTPGSGLPDVASINLRALTGNLLDPAISNAVADDVTDLTLRVGAVAASSTLDTCITRAAPLSTRAYGVAGLGLDTTSRAVAAVATTASSAVGTVQAGLAATGPLATSLGTTVRNALGTVTALTTAVGLGTPSATLTVTANLPAAFATLNQTLGAGSAVQVDLPTGAVHVDLARLTSSTDGVNNLPPNSEVLTTGTLGAATTQVGTLLDAWTALVSSTVTTTLNAASTSLVVDIPLSTAVLGTITTLRVTVAGTFATIAAGNGTVTTQLVGGCSPGAIALVCGTVNTALPLVVAPVRTTVGTTLSGVFQPTGLVGTLGATLATAVAGVVGTNGTGGVLRALFAGLPAIVSAQVNARPDVPERRRPGLSVQPGEHAVTALRVGLSDAARAAWLALGSATAGPNSYDPPR